MANNKSAEKRTRQAIIRRNRNRSRLSRLRSEVKKVRTAVAEGRLDEAKALLPGTLGLIDRTAQKGAIHHRAAARRKSRLSRMVATSEA